MVVVSSFDKSLIGFNSLPPLLFEYLMRVQAGALPGSFSRQCFEMLRHFRLRVCAELGNREMIDLDALEDMRIIRSGPDGSLRQEAIEVAGGFQR